MSYGTPDTATIGIWLDGVNESTGCVTPPTVSPAPTSQYKEARYVGNPCGQAFPLTGKCTECTGDCDDDSDCEDGLVCYDRSSGDEDLPGCVWGADSAELISGSTDFCKLGISIFSLFLTFSHLGYSVCIFRRQTKYRGRHC